MSGTGNDTASIEKEVVTFSGQPERQRSDWCVFDQLFLATIREVIGDVLTGKVREPRDPAADTNVDARNIFATDSLKHERMNKFLYGRSLMAVANGSLRYESSAVSIVLAHGSVHSKTEGHSYEAFQALEAKYQTDKNYKPWDLEQRLRAAKITP